MYRGIYIALSGAILKETQMESITRNLSNSNTAGYKREKSSFRDFIVSEERGRIMTSPSATRIDFSEGQLIRTGNPLDIAINGNGFISLAGNRYTRRGDLKRDRDGFLTTEGGIRVLGKRGPIRLPEGKVEIDRTGNVYVNGVVIDTLKIIDFSKKDDMVRIGDSVFYTEEAGKETKAEVMQGYIEGSNVSVIDEMVRMITTLREFESYQKIIHAFDEATSKLSNEIAKI
ncbi:MAG: flagellar hook-basal body protein [Thermodesulfovibrionales bacterium]